MGVKEFKLTGDEPGPELVNQLASLRLYARLTLHDQEAWRIEHANWQSLFKALRGSKAEAAAANLAKVEEHLLQMKFEIIEIGNYLMPLCTALDAKAPRSRILDALEVNQADRDTANMRKYGHKTMHVIGALGLENSATKDDGIATRPLKWCQTMAFMHALQTNEKLDRVVHDGANQFFNGAFGEYRERPLTERLAGRAV